HLLPPRTAYGVADIEGNRCRTLALFQMGANTGNTGQLSSLDPPIRARGLSCLRRSSRNTSYYPMCAIEDTRHLLFDTSGTRVACPCWLSSSSRVGRKG